MPWVRLDEQFPDHPKVVIAGPLAAWLHVAGLAYCNRMMTDGFIPYAQVGRLADFTTICIASGALNDPRTSYQEVDAYSQAERLVDTGVWEERSGGFVIHDYLDYQPSRTEIEAQRKVKADAGRKGGLRSGQRRRGEPASQQTGSKHEADASPRSEQNDSTPRSKPEPPGEANQEAKPNPDPDPVPVSPSGFDSSSSNAPSGESDENDPITDGTAPRPHPDQAVLDHIGETIGWTSPLKRAQLRTEWDYGAALLDRTALEDILLRCTTAKAPNYLRSAITSAARTAGVSAPEPHPPPP